MERNIFGCGKIFSEFVSGRMVCSNSRGYTGKNDEIEENTNNENKEFNEKILIEIESYLKIKENIQIQIEDYKFLKTIAQELRKQEVRRTDISTPPLFVIKNSQGQEMFFITRKALNEYIECNKKSLLENKTIIEIPSNNSYELEKLIEIIKRNF